MPQNPNPDEQSVDMPAASRGNSDPRTLYRDRLNHWAVVHSRPDLQKRVMVRFRSRADADGHLRFLCRHLPPSELVVVFDPQ